MKFTTVDDLLTFAIGEEEKAAAFYTDLADQMERPWMKKNFLTFAKEEMGHKAMLEEVRNGKQLAPVEGAILDLKILETLKVSDVPPADMDYQQALIIAMKAEKEAFILYTSLAEVATDPNARNILLRLAQEEAKHKLRFEMEYDDYVLQEN